MNSNEKIVVDAICKLYGINRRKKTVINSSFKEVICEKGSKAYIPESYYQLWIISVEQDGWIRYFVCPINGEPVEVELNDFVDDGDDEIVDKQNFINTIDGKLYSKICGADGKLAIVPSWWLDMLAVKRHLLFQQVFGKLGRNSSEIKGVFEFINTGENVFFSWVFYFNGDILSIFNIEIGDIMRAEKIVTRIPLNKTRVTVNDMEVFCKRNQVQCQKINEED